MATSSSSSDEDLSLFQSVAVTADDIAESARKEAAVAGRRTSGSAAGTARQPGGQITGKGPKGEAAAGGQPKSGQELDLTSLKIAAALDALLAKKLEVNSTPAAAETSSSLATVAAAGAAGASAAAACGSADAAASTTAADHSNSADDAALDTTGIRLFKHVTPGVACVITNTEYGDLTEVDLSKPHLDPRSRRRVRLRDMIPRYCLAATTSKRQQDQMLAALAVDGDSLLQAAVAATGTAWQQQQGRNKKQQKSAGRTLAAWQCLKKRKVEGLVMDAKEFVPHDARMATLLRLPLPE